MGVHAATRAAVGLLDELQDAIALGRRGWPVATTAVFVVTAATSVAQLVHPPVFAALHRDPEGLAAGEWWRVASWMFVQDGWLAGTVLNLAALACVGAVFERIFGSRRWLLAYFVLGLVAQVPGFVWNPYGAGNSVPVVVLLGGLVAVLVVAPRWFGVDVPAGLRVWTVIVPVLAVVDTALRDNHGVAALLGTLLGLALLWPRRLRQGAARA